MSPWFLGEVLNCRVVAIHVDADGEFPRLPEPRREALARLQQLVVEEGCEVGFAQDPDGDRLAVVDEKGRVLDPDEVLALAVEAVLEERPGDVVVNLSSSQVIEDIAQRYGVRVHRTPVGEANVVEVMRMVGAAIGGEGSNGGVIYPAVHACRDSYTGMALILWRMARTGKRVSELAERLPQYYRFSEKLEGEFRAGVVFQELERRFRGAVEDRRDGLKLHLEDGWIHVRPSNTEPIVRIAVEARTEERGRQLFEEVMELVQSAVA